MILHTTPSFLNVTTTPPRPTSRHRRPLLYLTKLYRHPLTAFLRILKCLRLSVAHLLPHHLHSSAIIPKCLGTCLRHDRLSRNRFQQASYLASSLSLRLELTFLPQRSLSPQNSQSISLSLHCLESVFPAFTPPQASFQITSCAMLPMIRPFLPPSNSCLDSLDDIQVWTALSICRMCPPEVKKSSFWEH
jgi:hypothetical protein